MDFVACSKRHHRADQTRRSRGCGGLGGATRWNGRGRTADSARRRIEVASRGSSPRRDLEPSSCRGRDPFAAAPRTPRRAAALRRTRGSVHYRTGPRRTRIGGTPRWHGRRCGFCGVPGRVVAVGRSIQRGRDRENRRVALLGWDVPRRTDGRRVCYRRSTLRRSHSSCWSTSSCRAAVNRSHSSASRDCWSSGWPSPSLSSRWLRKWKWRCLLPGG